jgi:hypothetical protein
MFGFQVALMVDLLHQEQVEPQDLQEQVVLTVQVELVEQVV